MLQLTCIGSQPCDDSDSFYKLSQVDTAADSYDLIIFSDQKSEVGSYQLELLAKDES